MLSRVLKLLRTMWMYRAGGFSALRRYLIAQVAPLLKCVPMVREQLNGEMQKLKADLEQDIQRDLTAPCTKLPRRARRSMRFSS